MKKVYLIHGWGGSSGEGWFSWLKRNLEKQDFKVYVFNMPDSNNPKIEAWVKYLEENVKDVDKNTFFIGHSIGCQTIMRFLEKLPKHLEIGGCIFVAGWFNLKVESYESEEERIIAKPWINIEIDFSRITQHTNKFLAIFSDDDLFVPLTDIKLFKERLNAKTILLKNKGHFDNAEEFEEAYKYILDFLLKNHNRK